MSAVKELVFADSGCRGFMFDGRAGVFDLQIWKSVSATLVAEQKRVALTVVPGILGFGPDTDQASVRLLPLTRRDSLGNDGASGVLPDMDHLGTGVRLLPIVRQGNRIEFTDRFVALQNAARIFPSDAEPVSTWVHEILERLPRHAPRLVTKL